MLLDRHRLAKLIELSDLERRVTGPERLLREEDVALLIKAAYDDASDAARAEFLARVKQMPTSAWPWSAVQATAPRGGRGGVGGIVYSPAPGALAPATLVLLRGQVDTSDADPGNRIPDRSQPEGAAWEPLHKALDLWDTTTIKRWVAPQGWMTASGTMAGSMSSGGVNPGNGGVNTSGTQSGNGGVNTDGAQPGNGGVNTGGAQPGNGGVNNGSGQPGEQPPPPPFSWRHPAVLVAGATALTTIGIVFYALRQGRPPALLPASAMNPAPAATATTMPSPATATAAPTTVASTATPAPSSPAPAPSPTAAQVAKEST